MAYQRVVVRGSYLPRTASHNSRVSAHGHAFYNDTATFGAKLTVGLLTKRSLSLPSHIFRRRTGRPLTLLLLTVTLAYLKSWWTEARD